ncbi:hypothetical protein JCM3775_002769 [Rhodotorula graminis]|uniref:GST N-terminal domain-containing protein n=1 Tax=Rhodotorula graminis (strain WP1) TaxID=578459 RepID=A0A0P9EG66_RHOGW|nr:uncharacterized protein RHOBADRAFT_55820 [Rhodotorula graminis WP1]KPV72339.1 hypothetical protein RHOBADRAFT_55820 [Rhodotorula graminis WP1]
MLPTLELVYWPIRGRAYPVLLLLKAARVPFTYTEIPYDDEAHFAAKARGDIDPDEWPFSALPVLKVKGDEGEAVLAETGAILRYLERVVEEELAVDHVKQLNALDQARVDMLASAADFNSSALYHFAASPTWLEGDERADLERERILPFLRSLEHQLAQADPVRDAALRPRELKGGGVLFGAAACSIAYTLSMVCDLFPLSLAHPLAAASADVRGTLAERFPACAAVLRDVEGSPGFAEWVASGERKARWSNRRAFTPDKTRAAAERWDGRRGEGEKEERAR